MKKLKTKIARVSILALSFLLVFFITVCFGTKKTKAYGADIEYVQYEILDHESISDLPYEPDIIQPSFGISQLNFGYFLYNNVKTFFLVLSPDHTQIRAGEVIIYLTNCNAGNLSNEIEDSEYYTYLNNNQDVGYRCATVIDILIDSGYFDIAPLGYYIRLDTLDLIGYGSYQHNSIRYLVDDVDESPDYYRMFGRFNNAYYSDYFYNSIITYYNGLIESGSDQAQINSYQRGVAYMRGQLEETVRQKDSIIAEKNQAIADLQEQLLNADTEFARFDNLLAAIFMYPIRFLTEGLDVNIFGINLGDFVLGLFMITIMLSLFRFILGRR